MIHIGPCWDRAFTQNSTLDVWTRSTHGVPTEGSWPPKSNVDTHTHRHRHTQTQTHTDTHTHTHTLQLKAPAPMSLKVVNSEANFAWPYFASPPRWVGDAYSWRAFFYTGG